MQDNQLFIISLILVAGFILGVLLLFVKNHVGKKLIKSGLILVFIGVMTSVMFGKDFIEVLLLIDVSGFGRAYIAGVVLLIAGIINRIFSHQ